MMEDRKYQLRELINKSEWTKEEKEQLLKYLETDAAGLKIIMQEQFDERIDYAEQPDADTSLTMLNRIHRKISVEKIENKKRILKMWPLKMIVAASLTGLFIMAVYTWPGGGTKIKIVKSPVMSKLYENDVAPGGNKAVLTLDDGSKIMLDDAQNGMLALQGHTKVIKVNGTLSYNNTKPGNELSYNTVSTPRGGQYQIKLHDGSEVWLNAASSLRFPTFFSGKERKVEITGEAYFEIAKNKAMPFIVSVNGALVQVLGTRFNVMAYDDEATLKTSLLEGSIKFINGNKSNILKPGQQSRLNKSGEVTISDDVDVEEVIAWKNGSFHFEGEDIGIVTRQLSRWYDVEVDHSQQVNDLFYAEIPRNTKLSDALKALELTGKVRFRIDEKKIIVME